MALDVIFQSLEPTIKPPDNSINPILLASVAASDPCEAQFFSAQTFLEAVYGDQNADRWQEFESSNAGELFQSQYTFNGEEPSSPKVDSDRPCCMSIDF